MYFPLDKGTLNSVRPDFASPPRFHRDLGAARKMAELGTRSIASAPAHASTVAVIHVYVYKRRRIRNYTSDYIDTPIDTTTDSPSSN